MEKDYIYNKDFSKICTLLENKRQTFINALCFTDNITAASIEVGVSKKSMNDFIKKEKITKEQLATMRLKFQLSNQKIKLRLSSNKK